jgi:hypothetical protein
MKLRRVYTGHYQAEAVVPVDDVLTPVTLVVTRIVGSNRWIAQVLDSDGGPRLRATTTRKADAFSYIDEWLARLPWGTWDDGSWVILG